MPLHLELNIELGNDAMQTYDDLAAALEKTAKKLRVYAEPTAGETGRIMDTNGLSVGRWRITKDDPGDDA